MHVTDPAKSGITMIMMILLTLLVCTFSSLLGWWWGYVLIFRGDETQTWKWTHGKSLKVRHGDIAF